MKTLPHLPARVMAYLAAIWLMGVACLVLAAVRWDSPDLVKFAAYLALGIASATVELPSPEGGTTPLTFLFVLVGAFEFSAPETTILATAVACAHCFWNRPKSLGPDQIAFQIAVAAIAGTGVAWLHHSPALLARASNWIDDPALAPISNAVVDTTALFLLNSIPLIVAVVLSEGVPFLSTWWTVSAWTMPYYLAGGFVALLASVASHILGWPTVLLAGPALYLVFRSYRLYLVRIENQKKHAEEVSALHLRTIEALALAIEAKDDTTSEHLARVQVYAKELARELGLSPEEQEALLAASILHDIGKLAVPEYIISKPGRLTPEEFEKMKIHPVVGAEILERVEFPYPVAPVVRAHHEKWDGSGYPYGLKGEDIPIGARILSAVDCLYALATDRQYRRALPLDEAMKVVQKDSGKAFDPRVVEVLARRYVELEKMAKAQQPALSDAPPPKLSKDVKFERGLAPDAGFEAAAKPSEAKGEVDFLTQIGAARQEMHTLFELSQELGNSLRLDETLSVLATKLARLVPHHGIAVWIRRGDNLEPEFVAGDDHRMFSSLKIPMGQGLSGWVAENRMPILNGNPAVESGYLKEPERCSGLRSAIAVPLEGLEDIVGVLTLYRGERDAFTRDHLRILQGISSKIGFSVENALRFKHASDSSTSDELTGLMNAQALFVRLDAELSRSRRTNLPVAVVTLDLNNFKSVNDRFGQLEGDRLLQAVAQGLKSLCRDYDLVARPGGDEFIMVLPGAHPGELDHKIERLRGIVGQATLDVLCGESLTTSLGSAYFPRDGEDAAQLLSEAERRMHVEKGTHKTRKEVFSQFIHPDQAVQDTGSHQWLASVY